MWGLLCMQKFCLSIILFAWLVCAKGQIKDPFAFSLDRGKLDEDIIYLTLPLKHIAPDKAAAWIKNQSGTLSKNELVNELYDQKALWIKIHKDRIHNLRQLIEKIDKPLPQVWIEARIVNVDEAYAHKLGLELSTYKNQLNMSSITKEGVNFPIVLAKLGSHVMLDLLLRALEEEGHGKVIARPKLLVSDGQVANIESGERVPYQVQTEHGGTSLHFANAVLRLGVTPHVLADKRILLDLQVNQDKVGSLIVHGSPGITTQALQTTVIIPEKNTVVLGGIYEEKFKNDQQHIPWLAFIPLIGKLFGYEAQELNRKELMIFITPRLVI